MDSRNLCVTPTYLLLACLQFAPKIGTCAELELSLSGGGTLFSDDLLLDLPSPADFVSPGQFAFSIEGRAPSLPGRIFIFGSYVYGVIWVGEGDGGRYVLVTGRDHTIIAGLGREISVGRGRLGLKLGPSYTWERLSPDYLSTGAIDHEESSLGYFAGVHLVAPLSDVVGLMLSYGILGHDTVRADGHFSNGEPYTLSRGNLEHVIQLGVNFRFGGRES